MTELPSHDRGPGPRYRRKTADERREALLQAALDCIVSLGVEKSSIRAIAERAGVSVGLINHHYGTKEALVAAAYRHVADDLLAQIEQRVADVQGDARQKLSAFIEASFSPVNLNGELFRVWLAFWTMQSTSPEIAAVHKERYGAYRAVLEGMIADLQSCDGVGQLDPRLAAIGLSGLLDGLWLEWCLEPATFTPAEGIRLAETWVDTVALRRDVS
ncbi:TetR family transcriptional regulator C-terminal domain-containing protein [Paracoccus sp. Z330]|uniref:TetR family transcriptional regulator C-terminal domain-containing protein n=1 Tax=Paracoccus onchidii TaxID=3017813 RepID=A0ABT4ZG51_9RHOB|nr:TetR family transcriptional regulator C-terminal domain-containing protein [Paracoccus onchidii]MDB6178287.1 TetR family transcriptional regulator C-terminal domain-containing protein [Paracoccus onchidii]